MGKEEDVLASQHLFLVGDTLRSPLCNDTSMNTSGRSSFFFFLTLYKKKKLLLFLFFLSSPASSYRVLFLVIIKTSLSIFIYIYIFLVYSTITQRLFLLSRSV